MIYTDINVIIIPMSDCTVCNICAKPGHIEESVEIRQIPSNVRRFQTEKFTVWRCSSCHSLHAKEDVALDKYYREYPFKQHKLDIWARAAYNNRLKRLLKEGLKKEHVILDYGCGSGLFVYYLRNKGYKNVAGFDPYVPEFSDKKVLETTYDLVTSQDVIEHDNKPKAFIEQLVRLVRPGGMLCIGTPNAEQIDLLNPEKFAINLHQPYHRHILSETALIQLGKELGLKMGRFYSRWYYDTLYPTVNFRFLLTYILYAGNLIDVAVEPPRIKMVLTSPLLLFYAFFGYFFPPKTEMMVFFHRNKNQ